MKSFFNAGAAQADITPPLGTLINGDFIIHYAQRIHDKLYAKALVLQNEQTTIAIVVVDICGMRRDFIDSVKKDIARETQINPEDILISATHTHYAGAVADLLMGAADLPYTQKLPGLIVEAVKSAQQKCRPAKIAYGAVDVPEHVVGRRFYMKKEYKGGLNPVTGKIDKVKTNPFGYEHLIDKRVSVVDTQLNYMAVRGTDDQWISVLANYSMHYVGDCKPGTITPDYFGVFAKQLTKKLSVSNDFVGILSNGASGEASIWDFVDQDRYPKGDYEKSTLIGTDLAEKVVRSMKELQWETAPALSVRYQEVTVATRKPSLKEVDAAKEVVAETNYEELKMFEGMGPTDDALRRVYAREQVLLNEYPDTISFPVQAIKIGSVVIGALAGEFFAETGLSLKKERPATHYFTICLANGYVGYVPPAHEIELGGYETWRCRTSFLAPEAEKTLRDTLSGLITELSK